jgi:hypothetical protein
VALMERFWFGGRVAREIDALLASRSGAEERVVEEAEIESLPEPVQRWLRWAQVAGKPLPATVRLREEGEFRMSEDRSWKPFEADQYFSLEPPGFIWRVTMRFAPLLKVLGRDRGLGGDASMQMRIAGLVPIVDSRGDQLAQGAMLRWLGEIIWFPQAALSSRIAWSPVDDRAAQATLTAGGRRTTQTFVVDLEGHPVEQRADRFNDSQKAILPWVNRNDEFGEFHGIRVPVLGEALWKYESGDFPYIRWRIAALDFDVPSRF